MGYYNGPNKPRFEPNNEWEKPVTVQHLPTLTLWTILTYTVGLLISLPLLYWLPLYMNKYAALFLELVILVIYWGCVDLLKRYLCYKYGKGLGRWHP